MKKSCNFARILFPTVRKLCVNYEEYYILFPPVFALIDLLLVG